MASVRKHRQELKSLQKKDPEFYEFLSRQQEGKELLGFGHEDDELSDDDDALDQDSEEEEEEEEDDDADSSDSEDDDIPAAAAAARATTTTAASSSSSAQHQTQLTVAMIDDIAQRAVMEQDARATRDLVHALRAAVNTAGAGKAAHTEQVLEKMKFAIDSVDVYHRVLIASLRRLPQLLVAEPAQVQAAKRARDADETTVRTTAGLRLRNRRLVQVALSAMLRLLPLLRTRSLQVFAMRCARAWVPLFVPFPKHSKALVKALLSLWATSEDAGVQLVAFLRIRQCALEMPVALAADRVLKGLYVGFLRATKALGGPTSAAGARLGQDASARLALMGNCVVEAAGLHPGLSYRHAFVYIRQLAVHLRAAMTNQTASNKDKVLRWQYVAAVQLWAAVLRAHAGISATTADGAVLLKDLIFPLVQVATGLLRLAAGPSWHPLRLAVVESLVELQWATAQFIPLGGPLLEVITFAVTGRGAAVAGGKTEADHSTKASRRSKAATVESEKLASNLSSLLRIPGAKMGAKSMRDALLSKALALMSDWLRASFQSPAFPELAAPLAAQLRAVAKLAVTRGSGSIFGGGVGASWRNQIRAVVNSLEVQCLAIASARATLGAAPSDTSALATFMAREREDARARHFAKQASTAEQVGQRAKRAALEAAAATASDDEDDLQDAQPAGPLDGRMDDEVKDFDMEDFE
jgi:nucleolar complex protein 2